MTNLRNGYLTVLVILFLFSVYTSCSNTGQSYLYNKPILNTGSIALPNCKPAIGLTKTNSTVWLHPELLKGKSFLFEVNTIIDWETSYREKLLHIKLKATGTSRQNGELIGENLQIFDFSCDVKKNGQLDNISHNENETLKGVKGLLKLMEIEQVKRAHETGDLSKWVSYIIPHFQVESFKPGDAVSVSIEDLSSYIKGMDNFPTKLVYKGISNYNKKTVIVIECNEKIVKDRLSGYQTGYFLYDYNTGYLIASESEVKVNYDQTKVFRMTSKTSTDMQVK